MFDSEKKSEISEKSEVIVLDYKKITEFQHLTNEKQPTYFSKKQQPPDNQEQSQPIDFDEAITLTKFGLFNYILIIISGTILTYVLFETIGLSFVLPISQCDLKLTTQAKGIVSAVGFAGIISSSHYWGFLADTKGRRKIILPTLFAAFICSFLSTLTNNVYIFTVLRYFTGFFLSGSSATIYVYLGEFHNEKNRSRAIMFASVIFGICGVLLPVIAWLVINQDWQYEIPIINVLYKPWRLFLVVCSLPSLICAVALLGIPESPKFTLSQGDQQQTIQILQKIYRINSKRNAEPLKITAIIEELETIEHRRKIEESKKGKLMIFKLIWKQTAPLFMRPHIRSTFIACCLQFCIYVTSNGMYIWFPEILNRVAEYTNKNPGLLPTICDCVYGTRVNISTVLHADVNSSLECVSKLELSTYEQGFVLEILYALGFAVIGVIIAYVGQLPIMFVICVGCGVCGITSAYIHLPSLAVYLFLILLLAGVAATVVNTATIDLYPTNLRAMAICISLMFGRIGSIFGSFIIGSLIDTHCNATFLIASILLICCGFLTFFIPNILNRKKKSQDTNNIS